jgi:pimeloyl-ACP methyl ester carboxylesterase
MMKNRYLLILVCALLFVTAGGEVNAKKPGAAVGGTPAIVCTDLSAAFSYPNTTLTSVALTPPGPLTVGAVTYALPEHCLVKGKMNERVSPVDGKTYAIGFEMRLPTSWNGRFFYQGNGGTDGAVVPAYGNILGGTPTTSGLAKGFAVISSDAGHATEPGTIGGGLFGIDPQARLDYGYNAVARLTPMAKKLVKTYFGKMPDKSYVVGSSNGGRHAMVAASRFADQYDGFLAGAPGFNLPKAAVAQLWGVQQYGPISDWNSTTGRPDISTSFTAQDTALVSDSIMEKCDRLDGVEDDMVGNPIACQRVFDINHDVPICAGAATHDGTCLSLAQKNVLAQVHAGAKNSRGKALYSNFLWDPGIRSGGWRSWKFVSSITNRDPLSVGFIFLTPPEDPAVLNGTANTLLDYALNWPGAAAGFDVDRDAPKIYARNRTYRESAMSFMTPPDLDMKQLWAKGGKLIVVQGTADPVFSLADTLDWYEELSGRYRHRTTDFARLFIVPGMSHSSGGPACDQFDLVDALVKWVEEGITPDAIVAKARGTGANVVNTEVPTSWAPNRTRPLCAYPEVPRYIGGDQEIAASFSCVTPRKSCAKHSDKGCLCGF